MKPIVLSHSCTPGPLWLSWMGAIACTLGSPAVTQAQIVPDATLPQVSTTSLSGTTTTIGGGSQAGANLFHSFDQFSIAPGTTASFQSSSGIERILTRVTGANASSIEGSLEVLGSSADFFLLNPNGIVFGPNASLNLAGSFVATTAERLQFPDGSFDALNPAPTALLSMSVPMGLQFGGSTGSIQVNGPGNGLTITQSSEIIKTNRPLGLQVQPQQTLALLGGPVVLDGGNVTGGDANGAGRVAIAAIGADSSLGLTNDALGWTLNTSNTANFSDVTLQNAASVDTSSIGGGPIEVYGQNILLSNGSTLLSETLGGGSGGAVTVEGRESAVLRGISRDSSTGQPLFLSSIGSEVAIGATGQGGAVNITAPLLLLQDGAQISSSTYGSGNSGTMTINAQQLVMLGANAFGPSGLGSVVGFSGTGRSGDIQITADEIVGQGSGSITTFAFGAGQGGRIDIKAASIDFSGGSSSGPSGIFAGAILGQGGGMEIETDSLTASGGAQISANTFGPGNGADITILAKDIDLSGTSPSGSPTGILTGVEDADATGNAGNIFLQAENIRVADGARIAVNTLGAGDGGVLTIAATLVDLTGARLTPQFGPRHSSLLATVDSTATGQGGVIHLDVATLNVSDGARVLAATAGAGDAGDVTINANEVNLRGQNALGPSSLLTSAILGPGAGGTITVNANSLNATDGAVISASNFLIGTSAPPGQGPAGIVILNVDQLSLSDQAQVTTASAGGAEGDIEINANILTLRRGASINANAFGPAPGGNIAINANFIIALADENSDITANAVDNRGGNVQILTGNLLGIQPRAEVTTGSDITASSALGVEFAGSITLNEMEVNPAQGLDPLPKNVVDPSEKVAKSCPGDLAQVGSSFRISGRGGLAASEQEVLSSPQLWLDSRGLDSATAGVTSSGAESSVEAEVAEVADGPASAAPLQEAHQLSRDRQGRIQLVALAGSMNPTPVASCQS